MEQSRESEKDLRLKDHLIFEVTNNAERERNIFLTNEAGMPVTINFRWIIDLNLKVRIIKAFIRCLEQYLHHLGVGK